MPRLEQLIKQNSSYKPFASWCKVGSGAKVTFRLRDLRERLPQLLQLLSARACRSDDGAAVEVNTCCRKQLKLKPLQIDTSVNL